MRACVRACVLVRVRVRVRVCAGHQVGVGQAREVQDNDAGAEVLRERKGDGGEPKGASV